ncbi:hypothetical protein [Paenarthrobacter sp. 2TAF44]|uniref:hypothetical protein n=1 Tax=Paenarthrobacter sp. 2TAF44 TaxID=3233018 RepID=UPI003F955693
MSNEDTQLADSIVDQIEDLYEKIKFRTIFIIFVVAVGAILVLSFVKSLLAAPKDPWPLFIGNLGDIVVQGLGVSIVAGLVLELVFGGQRREATKRLLKRAAQTVVATIQTESRAQYEEMIRTLKVIKPLHYPTHVFRGTGSPDPEFNTALMKDLASSKHYYFQGTGGSWTALRMHHLPPKVSRVSIMLPDPSPDAPGYVSLIRYEMTLPHNRKARRTYEQIQHSWRSHIAQALVGLFLARGPVDFEISFLSKKFSNRFEIFDNAAYVCALERDEDSDRKPYPETLRFDKQTFTYPFLDYIVRNPGAPSSKFNITRNTTEAEMIEKLNELRLLGDLGASLDWTTQNAEFNAIKDSFTAFRTKHEPELL